MLQFTYGGLTFTTLRTATPFEREVVFDSLGGGDYLFTRVRGSLELTYSPPAASFQGGSPPNSQAGRFPAETDAAIRHWLETPRRTLTILAMAANGQMATVLQCPSSAAAQGDATVGPLIKVNSVSRILGERTWLVGLSFECCINESPDALLVTSNRWTQSVGVNFQHLATRTTEGVVRVRGDKLRATTNPVDTLRSQFLAFSIPVGFKRTAIQVSAHADGVSASYMVRDEEQAYNLPANCPAVRLEVMDGGWVRQGSWGRAFVNAMGAVARRDTWLGVSPADGRFFSQNLIANLIGELPKRTKTVLVRAWGNRSTSRVKLVDLGLAVALARIGGAAVIDTTTTELLVTQDTANFVTVSLTKQWDWATGLHPGGPATPFQIATRLFLDGTGVIGGPGDTDFRNSVMCSPDTTTSIAGGTQTVAPTVNPPFPNDGGTRGTWLGNVVAQALTPADQQPPAPP